MTSENVSDPGVEIQLDLNQLLCENPLVCQTRIDGGEGWQCVVDESRLVQQLMHRHFCYPFGINRGEEAEQLVMMLDKLEAILRLKITGHCLLGNKGQIVEVVIAKIVAII